MRIYDIEVKENRLLLAAAGLAAAIALIVYLVLYVPLLKDLARERLECASCENDLALARDRIESAGKICGGKVLMGEKSVSVAIDELTRHGKSIGINFVSLKPLEIKSSENERCKILPVVMEIEADDEQFINFLGSLDELKKSSIKVKSFDVVPNKEDRRRLTGRATLDIYFSASEHAQ